MAYTDAALNIAVDALAGDIDEVSLHSADPGTTGTNELSGGTYARQAVTFAAGVAGEAFVNNAPTFDVPASATVAYVGFWDSTGPTFRASAVVTTETYSENGGTYQVLNTTKLAVSNTV